MTQEIYAKNRAFTLIELLIASSISAVVILSLYSAFQTGILSRAKIDAAFEVLQSGRIILNRIESDLKNAYIYTDDDSRFAGAAKNLGFFSVLDTYDKDGKVYPDIYRLNYEFSVGILKRTAYKGRDALLDTADTEAEVLSGQIKDMSFQYGYATGDPDNPYDWQDAWPKDNDPQQKKRFPLAVKVTLLLIEQVKKKETTTTAFSKIIPLPLSGKIASPQGAPGAPVPAQGGGIP